MKIEKDGESYIVKADNFMNLQESKDYFFIEEKEYQELNNSLSLVLDFVERWNKQDREPEVAEASRKLEKYLEGKEKDE